MLVGELFVESVLKGNRIFFRNWLPDRPPYRGVVFLVHGFGEHCGRYDAVVSALTAQQLIVRGVDHLGHGRSDGARAAVLVDAILGDLESWVSRTHLDDPQYSILPFVVLGHSMGGMLATLLVDTPALRARSPRALALSAPLIDFYATGWTARFGARHIGYWFPHVALVPFDPSNVSRVPEAVEAYVSDPLVYHGKVTLGTARELLLGTERAQKVVVECPFLGVQGRKDVAVDPDGVQIVLANATHADKRVVEYAEAFHELFNEPEGPEAIREVVDFFNKYI